MNAEHEKWMDEHYPRCVRCGLRTYVSNFTRLRNDAATMTPQCPAWNEENRPAYPYFGSRHEVAS